MGGNFFGSFADSALRTYATMQGIKQGRQQLEMQQKEADLKGKLIDLQTQKLTDDLTSGRALKDAILGQGGQPMATDLEGTSPAVAPKTFTLQDAAALVAPTDKEGAIRLLIEGQKQQNDQLHRQQALAAFTQAMGGQAPGSSGEPDQGTAMPAAGVGQQGAAPQAPAQGMSQAVRQPRQQLEGATFDPMTGDLKLKTGLPPGLQSNRYKAQMPNGMVMELEDVFDPQTGAKQTRVVAIAPSADSMQQTERIVSGWGMNPYTPEGRQAVSALLDAQQTQRPEERNLRVDAVRRAVQGQVATQGMVQPPGGQPAPGIGAPQSGVAPQGGGDVYAQARQMRAAEAGAETAARTTAQRLNEPPNAADTNRMVMLQNIERQAQTVQDFFRQEYVGKGLKLKPEEQKQFQNTFQQFVKDTPVGSGTYKQGAFAGAVRKFLGKASPEEVQFRDSLLDMADLLLRARSGASINEQEFARMSGFIPNLYDEPATFLPRLQRFKNVTGEMIYDTLKMGGSSRQELLQEREKKRQGGTPKSGPAPQILKIEPVR